MSSFCHTMMIAGKRLSYIIWNRCLGAGTYCWRAGTQLGGNLPVINIWSRPQNVNCCAHCSLRPPVPNHTAPEHLVDRHRQCLDAGLWSALMHRLNSRICHRIAKSAECIEPFGWSKQKYVLPTNILRQLWQLYQHKNKKKVVLKRAKRTSPHCAWP